MRNDERLMRNGAAEPGGKTKLAHGSWLVFPVLGGLGVSWRLGGSVTPSQYASLQLESDGLHLESDGLHLASVCLCLASVCLHLASGIRSFWAFQPKPQRPGSQNGQNGQNREQKATIGVQNRPYPDHFATFLRSCMNGRAKTFSPGGLRRYVGDALLGPGLPPHRRHEIVPHGVNLVSSFWFMVSSCLPGALNHKPETRNHKPRACVACRPPGSEPAGAEGMAGGQEVP